MSERETFEVRTIGHVRRDEDSGDVRLEILEPFRPALKQLDKFSHVIAVWWADQHDNEEDRKHLQTRPPYAEDHLTGIFATRAEYRPNPIATTTCRILGMEEESGIIRVKNIDAYDGTPILDLKAYFPVLDRVKKAHIAEWLGGLGMPEWVPEEGIGFYSEEG